MGLIHYIHYDLCPYRREGEVADTERERGRDTQTNSCEWAVKRRGTKDATDEPHRTDSFLAMSGAANPTDTLILDFWPSEL